jgi:Cu/Ag efflux protein CusF
MKAIETLLISFAWAAMVATGTPAAAQATMDPAKSADAGADMSDAEVRKIDREQGKVTLKHGPIRNLDMPPMTMVFHIKDKAMLDSLEPGDQVKFRAANQDGKMTVVEIRSSK